MYGNHVRDADHETSPFAHQIDEEQLRIEAEERVLDEIRARDREKQQVRRDRRQRRACVVIFTIVCLVWLEQFIHNAATRIQKVYRGMVARREFAKMTAKSKKGGKSGGKKGGKKAKK